MDVTANLTFEADTLSYCLGQGWWSQEAADDDRTSLTTSDRD